MERTHEDAHGPAGPWRCAGPSRCPDCAQRVEVYPLAIEGRYIPLVPGEYPARRVPQDAAVHLSRGLAWEGRDGSGSARIRHASVCPFRARPEHPELSQMWLRLRIRAMREGVPGFDTPDGAARAGRKPPPGAPAQDRIPSAHP